jgi:hypothetical protein
MATWTKSELSRIAEADELQLASRRRDGTLRSPVTMWVVRDGDDLYVRSIHGQAGSWFRGSRVRHDGHIRSGGVDRDVRFADADTAVGDRIDAAYRSKYHGYASNIVDTVVNAQARAATVKLVPR